MPFVAIAAALAILLVVLMGVRIVPQQSAFVIERPGRFNGVLTPGLNVIIPFIDKIAYRHTLKEVAVDIPEQVCVTVRHRGTVWQARTVRGDALAAGEKGIVTGVAGIELRVRRA